MTRSNLRRKNRPGTNGWGVLGDVWLGRDAATKLGVKQGDTFSVLASGRVMEVSVRKVLGQKDSNLGDDLVLGDLPTIQNLLSRPGEINRVEVVLRRTDMRENRDYLQQIRKRLSDDLPVGMRLSPTENRAADRAAMTAAFRLNLTILSLIAILVGAYLILQALDAAVVRKRTEIATLRSLGVNRRIIFFIFILEAGVIGVLGSLSGIGVGYLLALGSIGMLTDTVNALYFATSMEALPHLDGLYRGARDRSLFQPFGRLVAGKGRHVDSTGSGFVQRRLVSGFRLVEQPQDGNLSSALRSFGSFASSFLDGRRFEHAGRRIFGGGVMDLGAALLSGQMLVLLARWLRPFCQGPVSRLACSRLRDGSSRHRLAVAGLVVAVGMVTGMFQMVDSFRGTIREWFDVRFQAELYVSERGVSGAGNVNGIDPSIMKELLEDPAIEYADVMYLCHARPNVGITLLAGVDMDAWTSRIRQIWLKKPGSLDPVENSEPALVSETFARRFGVLEGGVVELDTPPEKNSFPPSESSRTTVTSSGRPPYRSIPGKNGPVRIAPSTPVSISRTALRLMKPKTASGLLFPDWK